MEWQPMETAPKDGRWVLLHCDFDHKIELIVARWKAADNPLHQNIPHWFDWQGMGLADHIPTSWAEIQPPA